MQLDDDVYVLTIAMQRDGQPFDLNLSLVVDAEHGATLVDLYARWQEVALHPEFLSADGFHPSSEGYQALADVFGEVWDARS